MSVLNTFLCNVVTQIVDPLILLLAAAAFVAFLWGVVQFIAKAGDESGRTEARHVILWGIVGLVIIFGAYGIINLTLSTFGVQTIGKICGS